MWKKYLTINKKRIIISLLFQKNLNIFILDTESWGIRNLKIVAQYDPYSISIVTEEFLASNFTESTKDWELTGVT